MKSIELFRQTFDTEPQITTQAHGRVNLIGEHTDYNNGFVLPTLIPQSINVSLSLREDNKIVGNSTEFGKLECPLGSPTDGTWLDFIRGASHYIKQEGGAVSGVSLTVSSTLPTGSGLSSSAALEVAVLRALLSVTNISLQNSQIALIGQQIEHQFVGTQCGIMDQMVSANAQLGEVLFLDCENLETKIIQTFPNHHFLIIHSGSTRKLSQGKYNERKSETEKASELLGVSSLRQASLDQLQKIENSLIQRRAKHIISENFRVKQAVQYLQINDATAFGSLMNESHESMKNDYEISSEELNQVVQAAIRAGALGARLTGAGFGGCVVVLCSQDESQRISQSILNDCPNAYWVTSITA